MISLGTMRKPVRFPDLREFVLREMLLDDEPRNSPRAHRWWAGYWLRMLSSDDSPYPPIQEESLWERFVAHRDAHEARQKARRRKRPLPKSADRP